MIRPVIVLAALVLGIVAAGNVAASAGQADDPVLDGFLHAAYGPRASSMSPWVVQAESKRQPAIDREVCARHRAGSHAWLAVCTTIHPTSHAQPGGIDFYVLRGNAGHIVVESSLKDSASGSMGVPGKVAVLALGRGTTGFRVEERWVGQGQVIETQSLLAPRGATLTAVATFRKGLDNTATSDHGDPPHDVKAKRIQLTFELTVDTAGPGTLYPLVVRERGVECGHVAKRAWKLTFDAARGHYRIPGALMREECLEPADEPGATHT